MTSCGLLSTSSLLRDLRVVELIAYGQLAFRVKLRAEVTDELTFQAWLNHNNRHTRYAYQVFRHDHTVLRRDNAPHHPELQANFPHHFHDADGRLTGSPLSGSPVSVAAWRSCAIKTGCGVVGGGCLSGWRHRDVL